MRVLICIHHLHHWAGSELVAIEMYEEFGRQGHKAMVFCPFVKPTFAHQALGSWRDVIQDPAKIDLADFDLVISLHQATSRFLHLQADDRLVGARRPFFVFLHLSSYEPFEAPGLGAQPHLADLVLANSEETRLALADYGYRDVALFNNPAPRAFVSECGPSEKLTRILSVSNHLPDELHAAFKLLELKGHDIYRIGNPENNRRVQPFDLFEHDAVVTTGKTAQYALRAQRPVYCYDQFQGPGWIDRHFEESAAKNFSGRCARIQKSPQELADDIEAGYVGARRWVMQQQAGSLERFHLETQVARIVDAAAAGLQRKAGCNPAQLEKLRTGLSLEKAIYLQIDRAYAETSGIPSPVVPRPLGDAPAHPAITTTWLREPGEDEAKVVAIFSYRFDAPLVPALLENIAPSIHGYVCWDDTLAPADDVFTDEYSRREALFLAAQAAGADWVFAIDPDERLEDSASDRIKDMTTKFGPVVWTFTLREMFTADAYRIDGIWNGRSRARLFPCLPGMEPDRRALHGQWTRNGLKLPIRHSKMNIYHLRMATPKRRALRRAQYAALDPTRADQRLGYDYLDDERGIRLAPIPEARRFSPPHVEDGGAWAAQEHAANIQELLPDPQASRLHLIMETRKRGGFAKALHLALDVHEQDPQDLEFALLAADCATRAREWEIAERIAGAVLASDPESLMALLLLARSLQAMGRNQEAEAALLQAQALVPGSPFCAGVVEMMRPAPARFSAPNALWRRWITGPAELREGAQVADCDMTVVVMSMCASDDIVESVSSLCQQSVQPEIVVVNSNGGDVLSRLGSLAEKVRIINVEDRLFPGGARNVGIDASSGRFVGFLASDCIALPGSVERRLLLHRSGARAVSAYVVPADKSSVSQQVSSFILHCTRHPASELAAVKKYSLSYDRDLFAEIGYFSPSLRVSEDTYLNSQIETRAEIVADRGVCIAHHYPDDTEALKFDMETRAGHRVRSPYFGPVRDLQGLRAKVSSSRDDRYALTQQALKLRKTELDPQALQTVEALIPQMLDAERHAAFESGKQVLRATQLSDDARRLAASDPERAGALLREAMTCHPHSPWLHLQFAQHLIHHGKHTDREEARLCLQLAADASLGDPMYIRSQIDALIAIDDEAAARKAFERACLLAPQHILTWEAHAALKTAANQPLRVYCLHQMFILNLLDRNVARTLAENYKLSGNDMARRARMRNSGIEMTDSEPEPLPRPGLLARGGSGLRQLLASLGIRGTFH